MILKFNDNKVGGAETELDIKDVVKEYVQWEKRKSQRMREYYPFWRLFLMFLMDFEPKPGLKFYGMFTPDQQDEIYNEYQKELSRLDSKVPVEPES